MGAASLEWVNVDDELLLEMIWRNASDNRSLAHRFRTAPPEIEQPDGDGTEEPCTGGPAHVPPPEEGSVVQESACVARMYAQRGGR